jgi:uncharacterized phage-associated protein
MAVNRRYFKYDPEKALQVILWIASRVRSANFHRISKIAYFADRKHLQEYGRQICGDNYVAMRHGPVPSGIYDMMKAVRGDGHSPLVDKAKEAFDVVGKYTVVPKREVDPDFFSESDIECLEWAMKMYGRKSFDELTKASHDAAWKNTDENDLMDLTTIIKTLPNAKELLEHLEGIER